MALSVYKVDDITRLILPASDWAESVITVLEELGHRVDLTDEDPYLCLRDEAELARRDALLESTGL